MEGLIPFAMILVVMYFLLWRPEQQRKQAHDALLASLAKDDKVVTRSGLHGRVAKVTDETVVLEIAKNVVATFDKATIARRVDPSATNDG